MDKNYVCGIAFLMAVFNTCFFALLLVGGIFGGLFSIEFSLSFKTHVCQQFYVMALFGLAVTTVMAWRLAYRLSK